MRGLQKSEGKEVARRLPLRVRRVLRTFGVDDSTGEADGISDVGSHSEMSRISVTERYPGVRKPDPGEVPLSLQEIRIGIRLGYIETDTNKMHQKIVTDWERGMCGPARGIWDGLLK